MSSESTLDSRENRHTAPKLEPLQEHFMAGSVIQLGSGETKKVEDLQTEDFIKSAAYSSDLSLEHSKLTRLEQSQSSGGVTLSFSQPENVDGVAVVSAEKDHPFFVSGHGWSSCSPTSSYSRYNLTCRQLRVGDTCLTLTKARSRVPRVKEELDLDSGQQSSG